MNLLRDIGAALNQTVAAIAGGSSDATTKPRMADQGHAFTSAVRTVALYSDIAPVNTTGIATDPGPIISRLYRPSVVDTQILPLLPNQPIPILDGDIEAVQGSVGNASPEPGIGIVFAPLQKQITPQLSTMFDWIYVGVAARQYAVGNTQKNESASRPDWDSINDHDAHAALKMFFRLYRAGSKVTCWLPVDCDFELMKDHSGDAVVGYTNSSSHPGITQRHKIHGGFNPRGIIVCRFDQVEFWNASQTAGVLVAPLIGRGGSSIIPR